MPLIINKNIFNPLACEVYDGQSSLDLTSRILHLDEAIIAVDKPSGMPTHPGPGADDVLSLMAAARNYLGAWVYPVHRLDRATSGVVVMARTKEVAGLLAAAFADRQVSKIYHAVVRGWVADDLLIDRPLERLHDDTEQSACTHVKTLTRYSADWAVRPYPTARYSYLELRPETGRTHQLRRHLAGISHPILGDTKYGDGAHNTAFREHCGSQRLLLHAVQLEFRHPISGSLMVVRSRSDLVGEG
ncbi:MAG: hypothetical protein FJ146_13675 [Deltaproteobacteria bacterium]|nr:hypothetical protein [Deltaproteobacteria bacterium]